MADDKIYFTPKNRPSENSAPEYTREQLEGALFRMSPSQFNWIVFNLRVPKTTLPPPTDPQATRAQALLHHLEQPGQAGIEGLYRAIQKSAPELLTGGGGPASSAGGGGKWVVLLLLLLVGGGGAYWWFGLRAPADSAPGASPKLALNTPSPAPTPSAATPPTSPQPTPPPAPASQASPAVPASQAAPSEATPQPTPQPTPAPAPQPAPAPSLDKLPEGLMVSFQSGSEEVNILNYDALKTVYEVMNRNPEMRVRIEGHSDQDGSKATNLKLSRQRAQESFRSLLTLGIDRKRFDVVGCGAVAPIADNSTEEGRQKNRRVEFFDVAEGREPCAPKTK
jgi:OOP family OmpA-OmpF porin